MAEISKITLPSGTTYDIKDTQSRQLIGQAQQDIEQMQSQIEALTGGDAIIFMGVSTTELTDGGNESPFVDGTTKTPATGQLFFYGTQEFIYGTDNKWHALGSLDSLGDLAYQSSASGTFTPEGDISQITFSGNSLTSTGTFTPSGTVNVSVAASENRTTTVSKANSGTATYTPEGTVSAPTITKTTNGAVQTIHNPTSTTVAKTVVAAAPGTTAPSNSLTYYSVSNETLSLYQLGYTTGNSITTSDVQVKTGDAEYSASEPTFTGTGARLVTGNISVPSSYSASFSGTQDDISVSGTPSGTVSQPTFSGKQTTITVE